MKDQTQITVIGQVKVFWYGQDDWGVWLFWEDDRTDIALGGTMVRRYKGFVPEVQFIPPGQDITDPRNTVLPEPPEDLVMLVKHFHETRAVMPLLDRLLEVYPDLATYAHGVLA